MQSSQALLMEKFRERDETWLLKTALAVMQRFYGARNPCPRAKTIAKPAKLASLNEALFCQTDNLLQWFGVKAP